MSRSTGRHGRTLVSAVMALSAFLGVAHAQGSEATLSNARLRQPRDRAFLTSAIRGAARRLGDPRCQELLGELRDRSRRPLREALEAEGVSAPEFLDHLYFYDGTESGLRRPQARVHGARLPRRVRLQQPVPRCVPAEHQPGRGRGRPRGAPLPRPRREPSHAAADQRPGAGGVPGVRGRGANLTVASWFKRLMESGGTERIMEGHLEVSPCPSRPEHGWDRTRSSTSSGPGGWVRSTARATRGSGATWRSRSSPTTSPAIATASADSNGKREPSPPSPTRTWWSSTTWGPTAVDPTSSRSCSRARRWASGCARAPCRCGRRSRPRCTWPMASPPPTRRRSRTATSSPPTSS